ncbi:MAG TPA: universal stress protein [Vicinamibacterales bacterium]|nr:universal stress protein [Vicinamibacterales bacterium]
MIALTHVLVPTDFSETSDAALAYGKAFASAFGATLHVIHIIEEPYGQPWAVEAYGFSLSALQDEWVKEAGTRMAQILTDDERASLKAVTSTVLGHPVMEILRYAQEHAVDLIVMGTHGRGPLGHMVMGSVAERIVRKASCPVLTVHAKGQKPS